MSKQQQCKLIGISFEPELASLTQAKKDIAVNAE